MMDKELEANKQTMKRILEVIIFISIMSFNLIVKNSN